MAKKQAAGAAVEAAAAAPTEFDVMEVLPEAVLIDPDIHALREWSGSSKQEMSLDELTDSIFLNGQLQEGVAWETPDGLTLIMGERRRDAIIRLRAAGEDKFFFRVRVDPNVKNKQQAVKMAIDENRLHEGFTDLEMAKNVTYLRGLLGAEGKKGTKIVADYIGVDPATVTQYERLLAAPEKLQESVAAGTMSMTAALEVVSGKEDKIEEVTEKAKARAEKRAKKETEAREEKERKAAAKQKREPKPVEPVTPVVTTKDVRLEQRAARALEKPKAPRGGEWIAFFEERATADQPPLLAQFAMIAAAYGHAKATDEQIAAAWDAVVQAMQSAGIADVEPTGKLAVPLTAPTAKSKKDQTPAKKKTQVKKSAAKNPVKKTAKTAAKPKAKKVVAKKAVKKASKKPAKKGGK